MSPSDKEQKADAAFNELDSATKENKKRRQRPWFAERYTLLGLVMALLAFAWSGMIFWLLANDKEVPDVMWAIIASIVTFYFKTESN